jgi:pyruvate,orthophosphate dikinase
MQTRAILQAALKLKKKGIKTHPEIMVPLTTIVERNEISRKTSFASTAEKVFAEMLRSMP